MPHSRIYVKFVIIFLLVLLIKTLQRYRFIRRTQTNSLLFSGNCYHFISRATLFAYPNKKGVPQIGNTPSTLKISNQMMKLFLLALFLVATFVFFATFLLVAAFFLITAFGLLLATFVLVTFSFLFTAFLLIASLLASFHSARFVALGGVTRSSARFSATRISGTTLSSLALLYLSFLGRSSSLFITTRRY